MQNIKELVKKNQKLHYGKNLQDDILYAKIEKLGETGCLELAMEEIGELIEVIAKSVNGKIDYWHIAEEIVDVQMVGELLNVVFSNSPHKSTLKKEDTPKKKKEKKSVVFDSIQKLAKTQRMISKCIRQKKGSYDKNQKILDTLSESTNLLIALYDIKKRDIEVIRNIKIDRDHSRYFK